MVTQQNISETTPKIIWNLLIKRKRQKTKNLNNLKIQVFFYRKIAAIWDVTYKYRSSHRWGSVKKCVPRNIAKFTGKDLCQRHFFNWVAGLGNEAINNKSLMYKEGWLYYGKNRVTGWLSYLPYYCKLLIIIKTTLMIR